MQTTRRAFLGELGVVAATAAMPRAAQAAAVTGPRFFVAAITPLDRKGDFDAALSRDLLGYFRERGVDGVLVMGTTGEFSSFSVGERKKILEAFLRDKGRLEVMCQVGTPNVPETLELLEHATAAGADSALVLPPFFFKRPDLEGVTRFFSQILEKGENPYLALSNSAVERGRDQPRTAAPAVAVRQALRDQRFFRQTRRARCFYP